MVAPLRRILLTLVIKLLGDLASSPILGWLQPFLGTSYAATSEKCPRDRIKPTLASRAASRSCHTLIQHARAPCVPCARSEPAWQLGCRTMGGRIPIVLSASSAVTSWAPTRTRMLLASPNSQAAYSTSKRYCRHCAHLLSDDTQRNPVWTVERTMKADTDGVSAVDRSAGQTLP